MRGPSEKERKECELREKRLLVRSMVDGMPLEEVDAWLTFILERNARRRTSP